MTDLVGQCRDWVWEWLTLIWNGIFKVPLITGPNYTITGGSLAAGVFAICVAIWIIHYFRDNTNAHMGGKK